MVELQSENGKRRYFCKSLRTTNYYEAQERAKLMTETIDSKDYEAKAYIVAAKAVMKQFVIDEYEEQVESDGQAFAKKVKRISPKTDPDIIKAAIDIVSKKLDLSRFTKQDQEFMQTFAQMVGDYLIKQGMVAKATSFPGSDHTIGYIVDSMLKKANNTKEVERKRYNRINNLLSDVGLKLTDKYSKFYTAEKIQQMCDNIKVMEVKGSVKRTYAKEISSIITHANALDPETYKTNLVNLIPEFKKTAKSDVEPHWPYSDDELKQIFSPEQDYFKENPDVFWTTLIGMFVGARCNAAITLQYADIINVDGIDCIKFQNTHPIKQLKNEATQRTVPIPLQLLNLGFVDYVKRQQVKLKAGPTDFIFPRCQTKSGAYNNKFTTRGLIQYIKDLGITKNNPHKLDFHSLRKNANLCLDSKAVPETFINDIIGWEGKGTRQQSYSNHGLQQIKAQADKLRYDFLQPEFDYWKSVMETK